VAVRAAAVYSEPGNAGVRTMERQLILVIDDHDDTRALLVRLLQLVGYEVVGVASGQQGIAFLEQERRPALIILDEMMPGVCGIDVLKHVRRTERLKDVRVIMYTAHASAKLALEARDAGADGFLMKGTDVQVLLETVRAHVEGTAELEVQISKTELQNNGKPQTSDGAGDRL
jgi:CheY-like chemotaxis protein